MASEKSGVTYLVVRMDDWCIAARKSADGVIDTLYEDHYYESALHEIMKDAGLNPMVKWATDEDADEAADTGSFDLDRLEDYFNDESE